MNKIMFPARAGMNRQTAEELSLIVHVPRTRGDEPTARITKYTPRACSPHARG